MKKVLVLIMVVLSILACQDYANACIGRILTIGILNAPQEQLLAEMVALLLNERTGTNVKMVSFKDSKELYSAVKKGEVGLVIENIERGMTMIGISGENDSKLCYDLMKKGYRKNLNLVWLEQFGVGRHYAPVISVDILETMPALPKLVGKLTGIINDETALKLIKSAGPEGKMHKVARDFLKAKRLI
ncbi:MAG TPA: glycine betaine ABC transporter substrate-binding protein [Desulfuromonadaceae bacterium]|jgi:glycine betaine/choline ABC-type transport system substrate-binding protein